MKTEYRVVWKREGMARPKNKRFAGKPSAERFVGILTSPEPWKFLRDTARKGPDDPWCCDGYECDCGGITVREWCAQRRDEMPPILFVRVEQRQVEPWNEFAQVTGNNGESSAPLTAGNDRS